MANGFYMAKYTGPKLKVIRALGTDLPGLTRKQIGKREHPPGQHGPNRRRRSSDYGLQLRQKQIVKMNYGLSEKQLKMLFKKAVKSKVQTGKKLLSLLESRLDNIVFRAGFAPTIPAARQLVNHGHILYNDKKANIPSIICKPGDTFAVKPSSQSLQIVLDTIEEPSIALPSYLSVSTKEFKAKITAEPEKEDVPLDIHESLIIEYYAKSM
jgi:small subunit ribosomal protein S4